MAVGGGGSVGVGVSVGSSVRTGVGFSCVPVDGELQAASNMLRKNMVVKVRIKEEIINVTMII